eukprot:1712933-Amphidinium_carterae.1
MVWTFRLSMGLFWGTFQVVHIVVVWDTALRNAQSWRTPGRRRRLPPRTTSLLARTGMVVRKAMLAIGSVVAGVAR